MCLRPAGAGTAITAGVGVHVVDGGTAGGQAYCAEEVAGQCLRSTQVTGSGADCSVGRVWSSHQCALRRDGHSGRNGREALIEHAVIDKQIPADAGVNCAGKS